MNHWIAVIHMVNMSPNDKPFRTPVFHVNEVWGYVIVWDNVAKDYQEIKMSDIHHVEFEKGSA